MFYSHLSSRRWLPAIHVVTLMLCAVAEVRAQRRVVVPADFLMLTPAAVGRTLPAAWRMRTVRGSRAPTTDIVDSSGHVFLRLSGTNRAAWFFRELEQPIDPSSGRLQWVWRIPLAPVGANSTRPSTDDAALRVFVVFARHSRFSPTPRALFYTVADGEPSLDEGHAASAAAMIVGRPSQTRHWTSVETNPFLDYRRLWGGTAPRIVAIGVMQDTDQTMTSAIGDLMRLQWSVLDVVPQ